MIEWYYREIEELLKSGYDQPGKFVVDKEALKRDHGTLTQGLEELVKSLDTLARIYKLRVAIWTREDSNLYYFVRWETYRWRLS